MDKKKDIYLKLKRYSQKIMISEFFFSLDDLIYCFFFGQINKSYEKIKSYYNKSSKDF